MRITLTEGERTILRKHFPSHPWPSPVTISPQGYDRLVAKHAELERSFRVSVGTSKLNMATAYECELLGRIVARCDHAAGQPTAPGGDSKKEEDESSVS